MKNFFLALTVAATFVTGCKKEDNNPDSQTYYPITAGTVHYYQATNTINGNVEIASDSVTTKDTLINGINYRIVMQRWSGYESQTFVRISGGNYYTLVGNILEQTQGFVNRDFLFFKDNAKVGDSWIATLDETYGNMICEVVETNGTYTVGGHTFTNVCATRLRRENGTVFETLFHAKGVGLIKSVYPGVGGYNTEITSYSVE
ncbi:MAG TPA: hypothetical protein VK154_05795 [Chitinophagales bacterium]|nr:hypothetical protein [Chitinophagales bacterium]